MESPTGLFGAFCLYIKHRGRKNIYASDQTSGMAITEISSSGSTSPTNS